MNTSSTNETPAAEELLRRAQEAMLAMFRMAPGAAPDATIASVTERVVESQKRAVEMMGSFAHVWADLAERGVSGPEAWNRVLDETTKMMTGLNPGLDPKTLLESWRKQGEQMLAMFQPWQSASGPISGLPSEGWPFGREMTSLLSSPGIGLTREYQARINHLFRDWLEYQRSDFEYKQALIGAWTDSFRRMAERSSKMIQEGRRFDNPKEMMNLWVEVADEVFTDLFHTEEFSRTQAEMLNAAHRVRRGKRALAEEMLSASDLPTKSDLDQAHKMIYELRRELRGLQRQVQSMSAEKKGQ